MQMAVNRQRWTRSDLDRLPDDGNRYEVLEGVLYVTPAPSPAHQRIVAWLNAAITPYAREHGIGVVHQPRSVIIAGHSQVEPDLMVLPPIAFASWATAPTPLLVVEVLSRGTRRRDMSHKRRFYLEKGVGEYWVVDRLARSVIRCLPDDREEVVTAVLSWCPRAGQPPLLVDVALMFSEA